MRLCRHSWLHLLLIPVLFALSSPAFSYCYVAWQGTAEFKSESATTACRALIDFANPGNISRQYGYGAQGSGTGGVCYFYRNTSYEALGDWQRGGTPDSVCEAPPPKGDVCGTTPGGGEMILNASGQCVQPEVADKPSYCKYLSGTTRNRRATVQFNEDGTVIPPSVSGADGCEGSVLNWDNCKMPAPRKACSETTGNCVSMQSLQASCMVLMNFTGEVEDNGVPHGGYEGSKGEDGLCGPGEPCDLPDFPNVNEQQPCSYVTDAEGRKSCSSFNYNGKPGNGMGCGTFNGEFGCYGTASSEGSQIDTKVTQTPTPDGGIKEEKTDVYTKVVCSGPGSCSSTTTTNKSTTIKNGNGETVSESSECTGPHCPDGGKGGKGDSDGDGFDDCATGKDCSEGTTAGIPGAPELEDVADVGDSTGDYFGRISNAPIVSAIANFAVPTGGSCPIYSAQTMIGTFDSSAFCNLAPELLSGLRFLFLALWAWAAVRLFMTA